MTLKAAFIFLDPGAKSATDRKMISTPAVNLTVVGTANYTDAEKVARELLAGGVTAFELCGGFGMSGAARITKAVNGKAAVGVVRFDCHPGLEGTSGDVIFG